MGTDRKQITFEDYLSLSRDLDPTDFNIHKLKHALVLNGFGGMKYLSRKQIIDALNAVNLTPATRSTIHSDAPIISRHVAPLSSDELIKDIQEIGWQECPIGSIETLNPATFGVAQSPIKNAPVNKRKKRVRKGKGKGANELALALPLGEKSSVNKEKKKRGKKGERMEGKELDIVANRDDDDVELDKVDANIKKPTVVKKKRTRKAKRRAQNIAWPSADSSMADALSDRDDSDFELTSPMKKASETIKKRVEASMLNDADEFFWDNLGFQKVKSSPNPRNYFKCKNWKKGCPARRHVDKDPTDPSILIVTYYNGKHNHFGP